MPKYTTIKVSVEDKRRLERLVKLMGWSISETLRRVIDLAERELLERHQGDVEALLDSLRYARDLGETDAERVDEILYDEWG